MGTLWNEFRRGVRRGKKTFLPTGLTPCPECAEPRGRARFADVVTGRDVEVDISCICDGVPCAWCGCMPIHRPAGSRFDADTATVRYSATWAAQRPCAACRAEGAAAVPDGLRRGDYELGATPFYGEAAASAGYFDGPRYRAFEASLPVLAGRHGVRLRTVTRVQGIWRGRHEPSALISVHGSAEDVLALMVDLADTWGQEGVLCFGPDPAGDIRRHIGATTHGVEEICAVLGEDPAVITLGPDGEVTILDLRGGESGRADCVLARLGAHTADVGGHVFIHLRADGRSP